MRKTTIISAPSGGGKTTLVQRLITSEPSFQVVTSHTTRGPRPGEEDGRHYHFVSRDQFAAMQAEEAFLEWAEVFGNLYGTSLAEIARLKAEGKTPILEIDVQGFIQVRPKLSSYYSVFIFPPSIDQLWQRLENRASESLEVRSLRLASAIEELEQAHHYDSYVINDDVDRAYDQLRTMLASCVPSDSTKIRTIAKTLIQEFRDSPLAAKVAPFLAGSPSGS